MNFFYSYVRVAGNITTLYEHTTRELVVILKSREWSYCIETLKWICCKTYGRNLRTMYKVSHFGVNLNWTANYKPVVNYNEVNDAVLEDSVVALLQLIKICCTTVTNGHHTIQCIVDMTNVLITPSYTVTSVCRTNSILLSIYPIQQKHSNKAYTCITIDATGIVYYRRPLHYQ